MAQLPDITSCSDSLEDRGSATNPFYSLNYHFGMLLGVEDFATEQAYHRGKMRLHNAWCHRSGVVWGFDVQLDAEHGEIRVTPGLALDPAGRELHLDGDACVNVGEWFLVHKDDEGFAPEAITNGFAFDAHVEIRFKSCLTRQVPALQEPCEHASTGTAYSRSFETVDIRLMPGKAPVPVPLSYHRLRVLFGLVSGQLPDDQPVIDERQRILNLPSGDQPAAYVEALRIFAALDGIDLQPAQIDDEARSWFPGKEDAPVILADISKITIQRSSDGEPFKLTGGEVDISVRPAHIATSTIQELLCGPLFRQVFAPPGPFGPRVMPETISIGDSAITLELDQEVEPNSVSPEALAVTTFGPTGWQDVSFTPTASAASTITLNLDSNLPSGVLVRLIVRGTGPKPLLGKNLAPLAGGVGGPEPQKHDGIDFVFMQERS